MNWSELADVTSAIANCARSCQACTTVIAIIVGGVWSYMLFIQRRQRFPRANLKHDITERVLTDNKTLLHIVTTISNTGEVLLSLASGETRVQQVLPLSTGFLRCIEENQDLVKQGETEVQWPLLDSREKEWHGGGCEIEPGETDEVCFDFILGSEVETVEIYSYFKNVKKRAREIGWSVTTSYELKRSGKGG